MERFECFSPLSRIVDLIGSALIAHNLTTEPQTIDVHRLKVPEAVSRVQEALYDAITSGAPELRIITGRGKHSKGGIPVLKLALVKAMQEYVRSIDIFERLIIDESCSLHINAVPDIVNPGVLLINIPAKAKSSV